MVLSHLLMTLELIELICLSVRVCSLGRSRLQLLLQRHLVVLAGRGLAVQLPHELDLMDVGGSS